MGTERVEWIHAPATFAFHGRDFTVQLALEDEGAAFLHVDLIFSCGEKPESRLRMIPTDGFCEKESYSVYTATVPAADLCGGELVYRFCREGAESGEYRVPLFAEPAMPELTITENCTWVGGESNFFEIRNISDNPVDLGGYELVLLEDNGDGGRNPLADNPGQNVLPAHTTAAFRFISPWHLRYADSVHSPLDRDSFFADIAKRYPETCGDIAERAPLLFQSTTGQCDPITGKYRLLPGCFEMDRKYRPHTLYLVHRGDPKENAIFSMEICRHPGEHHVRRCHAQLWCFDPREPAKGVLEDSLAAPTPGFPDMTQVVFDAEDHAAPAILAVHPFAKIFRGTGDIPILFAAVGRVTGRATVYVKEDGQFVAHRARLNNNGVFEWVLPARKAAFMEKLCYYLEVTGGLYTARYGSAEDPVCVVLEDNAGPEILKVTPADLQVLENEFTPEIRIAYHDISGVNGRISVLCLDGINVSESADFKEHEVVYVPQKPLSYGKHTVEITLRDMLGNRTYRKSVFSVSDGKELFLYKGQVHSHTNESDGLGTPEEAIAYARDVGKVDFFAVTDHSHYQSDADYERQRLLADSFNDPTRFATLYGFEMTYNDTNGYWGHVNVLNTSWINSFPAKTDLPSFYRELEADPEAVTMFNHPDDQWGDFNEYAGRTELLTQRFCLSEIRSAHYDPWYALSLSKGYRTGPVSNEDNHAKNWTTSSYSIGYVLAPALTRENILYAMRRRRTYTTCDRNMQIRYRVNGEWLGSVLHAPEKLTVTAEITTDHPSGIGLLELMSEDNITVASVNAGPLRSFSWEVELDPDFDYYYLRITNGGCYSATAPVFIEGRDWLNITDMSYSVCAGQTDYHVGRVTVQNSGEKPLTDVTVDYYLSGRDGFGLRKLTPYRSVRVGRLAPGETRTVCAGFPDVLGNHRLSAVVSGFSGKARYADTAYILLTPAIITRILPLTSPVDTGREIVENPFPYVELFNPSDRSLPLKGFSLRLWDTCGEVPSANRILPLDGASIAPGGTLVIWIRKEGSGLTAEDFNQRYGTKLTEGEDLFITPVQILSAKPKGRKLDLTWGGEILTRVSYGYYCSHDRDVEADCPLYYRYEPHMTVFERKMSPAEKDLRPGTVSASQIPPEAKDIRSEEWGEQNGQPDRPGAVTRLTRASLVPFRAAALMANAMSAFKGFRSNKK